jgi:hypothetical protein
MIGTGTEGPFDRKFLESPLRILGFNLGKAGGLEASKPTLYIGKKIQY